MPFNIKLVMGTEETIKELQQLKKLNNIRMRIHSIEIVIQSFKKDKEIEIEHHKWKMKLLNDTIRHHERMLYTAKKELEDAT